MPQTMPLTNKISQSSGGSTSYRLNVAQFGDGYSQRTPDGINYIQRKWTVAWDNLTASELTTVQTFLDIIGDGQYFTWQPPGLGASLKWILDGETRIAAKSGNLYAVSFSCKQVYDL